MTEPLAARDIRLAEFGSRIRLRQRSPLAAALCRITQTGQRWKRAARRASATLATQAQDLESGCNPQPKYRKQRVPDCPNRETQSGAFAFLAVSKACRLPELSGRSSICSIPPQTYDVSSE